MKFSKNVNNKKHAPKLRKIRIIFDIENWLWKSEIVILRLFDLERRLIWQKKNYDKVLFFTQLTSHLMRKLQKKILNVIYYTSIGQFKIYRLVNAERVPSLSSFLTTFMNAPKPQSTTLSEEQVLNSWLISLQLDIFSYSEFIISVLEFPDY